MYLVDHSATWRRLYATLLILRRWGSRINRNDRASELALRPLLDRQVRREIHLMNIHTTCPISSRYRDTLLYVVLSLMTVRNTRFGTPYSCGAATPVPVTLNVIVPIRKPTAGFSVLYSGVSPFPPSGVYAVIYPTPTPICVYSQVLPARRDDPLPEDGALDFHVGLVEGVHDGLDPVLVDLEEEVLDGLLGRGAGGVGGDGRRGARGARGRAGAGLVQQEEPHVAAGHEARYVVAEELVDHLEVPGARARVSLAHVESSRGWVRRDGEPAPGERPGGPHREGEATGARLGSGEGGIHLSVIPLHLLDDVQRAVQDELIEVAGLVREAGHAVAALLRGAELVLEEGVVLGANDGEVVRHGLPIDHLRPPLPEGVVVVVLFPLLRLRDMQNSTEWAGMRRRVGVSE